MAALNQTRPSVGFSAGNIFSLLAQGYATFTAWNDARITRNSLFKLSARELDDIGLCAADIEMIATRGRR